MLVDGHRLVELVAEAFAEENDVRFHNTLACGGLRGGDTQVRPLTIFCYVGQKTLVICLGANQFNYNSDKYLRSELLMVWLH